MNKNKKIKIYRKNISQIYLKWIVIDETSAYSWLMLAKICSDFLLIGVIKYLQLFNCCYWWYILQSKVLIYPVKFISLFMTTVRNNIQLCLRCGNKINAIIQIKWALPIKDPDIKWKSDRIRIKLPWVLYAIIEFANQQICKKSQTNKVGHNYWSYRPSSVTTHTHTEYGSGSSCVSQPFFNADIINLTNSCIKSTARRMLYFDSQKHVVHSNEVFSRVCFLFLQPNH